VLREIFGPLRGEGTGRWRMSRNEEALCMTCDLPQILLEYDFKQYERAGFWHVYEIV
jgi:hypothetical protein